MSHHFDDLKYPLKELKPKKHDLKSNADEETETKDGDLHKEVWTVSQAAIFEDLKTILFNIVRGNHIWTRNSRVQAYHPNVATPPYHTDTCRIVIQSTFGGKGGDHVMILRGQAWDQKFREMALSLVMSRCSDHRGPLATSQVINRTASPTSAEGTTQHDPALQCEECRALYEGLGVQKTRH